MRARTPAIRPERVLCEPVGGASQLLEIGPNTATVTRGALGIRNLPDQNREWGR